MSMKLMLTLFFISLSIVALGQVSSSFEKENSNASVSYSDYFSFHGEDELGKVYFAIDNNRAKTKKGINKGDHFLYFSVDGEWMEQKGHKMDFEFENSTLEKIPSSEYFKFIYNGNTLTEIESPNNGYRIVLSKPLKLIGEYGGEGIVFDILSTEAILYYGDREFKGNIISEKLIDSVGLLSFANLTKGIFNGYKFDGYYLNIPELGDMYIHLIKTKASVNFIKDNILNLNDKKSIHDFELKNSEYVVTKSKQVGLKKLPLEFEINSPDLKLKMHTTHFKTYRNLFFFAFGMGVIEGELIYQGKSYAVYGLSELFKL